MLLSSSNPSSPTTTHVQPPAAYAPNTLEEADLAKVTICPICLTTYEERVYLSPCFHSYCAACLDEWVAVSVSCPLCKTQPDKLHYGVDTTRRILQTISISQPSPALALPHWRDQLHSLALYGQKALASTSTVSSSRVDEVNAAATRAQDEDEEMIPRDFSTTSTPTSTSQRSRSPTPIDSISTSTFDYDTQPFYKSPMMAPQPPADTSSFLSSSSFISFTPTITTSSTAIVSSSLASNVAALLKPDRIDVYLRHLVPTPVAQYPKAMQIYPHDLPRLRPFLERDLAILTESFPAAPSTVVQSHIESLLCLPVQPQQPSSMRRQTVSSSNSNGVSGSNSHNESQWRQVVDRIAEWITFSAPSASAWQRPPTAATDIVEGAVPGRTPHELAQQFVDEMRQVAHRRLALRLWDEQVFYGIKQNEHYSLPDQ
ncbi:hypothetical protein BGW42_003879 [Actinomortierella wolfii]|nr:hypothetical protein BGW42_003879 [Actinomortierella wolfii]